MLNDFWVLQVKWLQLLIICRSIKRNSSEVCALYQRPAKHWLSYFFRLRKQLRFKCWFWLDLGLKVVYRRLSLLLRFLNFLRYHRVNHSCRMQCLSILVHLHLLFERQAHRQSVFGTRSLNNVILNVRYYLRHPMPFLTHSPFFLLSVNRLNFYTLLDLMCMRRQIISLRHKQILSLLCVTAHRELRSVDGFSLFLAESWKSWRCVKISWCLFHIFGQGLVLLDISCLLWLLLGIKKINRVLADHIPNVGFFVYFAEFARAITLVYYTPTLKSFVDVFNLLFFLRRLLLELLQNEMWSVHELFLYISQRIRYRPWTHVS